MQRLLAAIILFVFAVSPAYSFAREQIFVKAESEPEFTRLFFYSKEQPGFSVSIHGNDLIISFKEDVIMDASSIAAFAARDISSSSFNKAANKVIIRLKNSNFSFRKFVGEDFVGVDIVKRPVVNIAKTKILKPKPKAKIIPQEPIVKSLANLSMPEPVVLKNAIETPIEKPKLRAIKPAKKPVKLARTKKIVAAKNEEVKEPTPEVIARLQAIEPAAGEAQQEKKIVIAQANIPAATAADTTQETSNNVASEKKEANINNAKPEDIPVAIEKTASQSQEEQTVENNQENANKLQQNNIADQLDNKDEITDKPQNLEVSDEKLDLSPALDNLAVADKQASGKPVSIADRVKNLLQAKLSFAWTEPVAASVFKRAGYLWIVFDKAQDIDVSSLVKNNENYFSEGKQLKNRFYTILRLKMISNLNVVAYKEDENWVVGLLNQKMSPENIAPIDTKYSELLGSRVVLSNDSTLKPLRLIDEEVGDEIIIFPFLESETGVKETYQYIDFAFLETAQGAVMQVVSDNVDVAVVAGGAEIAGPANKIANASQSALQELRQKEEELARRAARLKEQSAEVTALKFNTWMLNGPRLFKSDLKELEWKIIESDWADKNKHRLELARFYLAHGLYTEALGVIEIMQEYDAKDKNSVDLNIVEATALYFMGRYKQAADIYASIKPEDLSVTHRAEIDFWHKAANLQISNMIKEDKFITKNPLDKKSEEEDASLDKVGNTRLMRDTSTRLLKLIRKMDPDFVNAEELQKLEATARFVTDHYQEAIKRFEETELYSSGDIFQAEDNKLWWSASTNKRSEADELPFLENINTFLKNYPDAIVNDFALLAIEDVLKRNDLAKAEEILTAFRDESRYQEKNSIEFFRGLYYAKNEEDDKAIAAWESLSDEIFDPFNRSRSQFAATVFQLDKKKIDVTKAIANLNSVRDLWRGGQLEFHILTLLGEFYMETKQYMAGFKVWREAVSAFPGSDESLLIAKKMSDKFVKIFSQGEADVMPQLDAITLYYEFRELTPIGKLGDEMISKLVDRLISVDLLDRATALLTHQVRFRLVGEERDVASTKLVRIHLMNHDAQKALDVLDATENNGISKDIAVQRRYLRARALLDLGKSNKVLALLKDDYSKQASFLRADVYWRNGVWRKVIDELEVSFREIRREERSLDTDETNQLIKLAVSYALIERQRRLQILYEDFSNLVQDSDKKKLLTFIATNKGPVDYRNLEKTVEYKDMENFLNTYMKMQSDLNSPSPSAQSASPATAG